MRAYARALVTIGIVGVMLSCGWVAAVISSHDGAADMPTKKPEPMFVAPSNVGNLYYHSPDCIYIDPHKANFKFYSRHEAQSAAELLPAPCCLTQGGGERTSTAALPRSPAETRQRQ